MVRFAISIGEDNKICKEHFGEGKEFWIYELSGDSRLLEKRPNRSEEEKEHGSKKKALQIHSQLKDVEILIGYRFGPNILRKSILDFLFVITPTRDVDKTIQLASKFSKELVDRIPRRKEIIVKISENGIKELPRGRK